MKIKKLLENRQHILIWSTNTDDYFDMVAWHPYMMATKQVAKDSDLFFDITAPDNLWKDYNEAAYRVMCKYGDGHKQVLLTENGFTDCGNPELEELYAQYNTKIIELASELPYVRTLFNFRLLNENAMLQKAGIGYSESSVWYREFGRDWKKDYWEIIIYEFFG